MDSLIQNIKAEQILDSRGNPTLRVDVIAGGKMGSFAVPSGASTGTHEAWELRDDEQEHYNGKGVNKAVANVNSEIADALKGHEVTDQDGIDRIMLEIDGTENKKRLGGNAIVGVSVACAKAAAAISGKELYVYLREIVNVRPSRVKPQLYMNLINGGKHAETRLAWQEYHVVPQVDTLHESIEMGAEIEKHLMQKIKDRYGVEATHVGDEGGFGVDVQSVLEPLELIKESVHELGFTDKIMYALDVAASSFVKDGTYKMHGGVFTPEELMRFYKDEIMKYPMLSIEDPFDEEEFLLFSQLKNTDNAPLVVGDDLTVTNAKRLQMAIDTDAISAIIIKPNQIGTLTETIETMKLAREHDIELIISHRSGETNDSFVSDLAYAVGAFGIKAGAPMRGERVAKLNRFLHIENMEATNL